jgi:8-oxo-dGTP pyrophosphatase MutT (NUDIX family)
MPGGEAASGVIPVSVKGILVIDGEVLLLRNPRGELELPGGRPEPGETFEAALRREVHEETGLRVNVLSQVDTWLYDIKDEGRVQVISFVVTTGHDRRRPDLALSQEHLGAEWHPVSELPGGVLPEGYCRSIRSAVPGL